MMVLYIIIELFLMLKIYLFNYTIFEIINRLNINSLYYQYLYNDSRELNSKLITH